MSEIVKKKSSDKPNFSGVVTALITPFRKGAVDYKSLKKIVRYQLDNGIQGLVVAGTTAESPTLSWQEVEKIYRTVRTEVAKQVPVLLGTGTNNTISTIQRTKDAKKWKADAALVVAPYYNKPPQIGMIEHFRAVAKSVAIPIVLYNVPGRTVVSMTSGTVAALAKTKNIVGIKEASGNLQFGVDLKNQVPKKFLLTSGDDSTCLEFILNGGHGVISVISHVRPKQLVELVARARSGERSVIMEYSRYENLNRLMGVEANPIPVKMAMYAMGLIASPELRLPLVKMSNANAAHLKQEMKTLGII